MKKKLSRHDQEIAYFLNQREGITQKKLAFMYDVSPAAMSGYLKEMGHEADKARLFQALSDARSSAGEQHALQEPSGTIFIDPE